MDVNNLIDLYNDGLLTSFGQVTATGLSAMTGGEVSHDKFTRLLASGRIDEQHLWKKAKPLCHETTSDEVVLIIDDSIEAKPYTDENELICWHYDHCSGRHVKGVNFLSGLYYSQGIGVPVAVEFVTKPIKTTSAKGKPVRKSRTSKNELFRKVVGHGLQNISFSYVLADSWFGNSANMDFVDTNNGKFIFAIKSNRKVALSKQDKEEGRFVSIKDLGLEGRSMVVWVKQLDFPVAVTSQVFKNGDDTAALYLASNDLELSNGQMTAIYQKRWKVEEFYKSIKSNTAFAGSPTRRVTTQKSHFIASMVAFNYFELLKIRKDESHFAMKNYLRIAAMKSAREKLHQLLTPNLQNAT